MRFTDTRVDEQQRMISIKAVPMSLVLEDSTGKSYLCNVVDTPGHVNFSDEMTAGMRLADGVVLVVDAVEGVMVNTERALKHALQQGLAITLCINKVDRLITELKLPPPDAYHKLRHTLEEVNALIASYAPAAMAARTSSSGSAVVSAAMPSEAPQLDPVLGNVCFASAAAGWSFTLLSFSKLYTQTHGVNFDPEQLAKRLWGDLYYHPDTRSFRRKPPAGGGERTFVTFVLEPLYKLYSQVVGEHKKSVEATLGELGVSLRPSTYKMNVKPLLKAAIGAVLGGGAGGLADMIIRHLPSAKAAAPVKVQTTYTGPLVGKRAAAMLSCSAKRRGPLMVHVTKLYPKPDCSAFDALGRVMCGTLRTGQTVRVLGEAYSPDDEEDMAVKVVTKLWLYQARYRVPISSAPAGSWVLIEGVDASITKTATLCEEFGQQGGYGGAEDEDEEEAGGKKAGAGAGGRWGAGGGEEDEEEEDDEDVFIIAPLKFNTVSVVKVATEPLNPSELPKMVEGLRKISKSYPLAVTRVEESGEHTVLGTGELFLDSVMKDLRDLFSEVEVKGGGVRQAHVLGTGELLLDSVMKDLRDLFSEVEVKCGEHTVLGTGELFLDSVMKDLRDWFSEVEVKVSEGVGVQGWREGRVHAAGTRKLFVDSAVEDLWGLFSKVEVKKATLLMILHICSPLPSSLGRGAMEKGLAENWESGAVSLDWPKKCMAEFLPSLTPLLLFIAEPMEKGLAEDLESGAVSLDWPKKRMAEFFQTKYDWDLLAARSIWAFGPDRQGPNILVHDTLPSEVDKNLLATVKEGPNILVNDTLPSEVDKNLLAAVKESVIQGFQWGAREGPLCDEPMRNVRFRLLDALVAQDPLQRGGRSDHPSSFLAAYSALRMAWRLLAGLMEPFYCIDIQTPADCMSAIYTVLSRRRGHVTGDACQGRHSRLHCQGHVTVDAAKSGTPAYIVKVLYCSLVRVSKAILPVIESFGFMTDLRYHAQGQAFCVSVFDHWAAILPVIESFGFETDLRYHTQGQAFCAILPVIESFGFETDLRYHTQGQAFCVSVFDHWAVVPGDPLDKSVVLHPLEPAPAQHLAREFMVKTRRRKGMSEDVSINKFFDDPMLLELARQDAELQQIL
ncbi:unnamed protein product [Closterium sp. NIES-64]|nr:unnamed protein product [Closterium sp. NIES-64]